MGTRFLFGQKSMVPNGQLTPSSFTAHRLLVLRTHPTLPDTIPFVRALLSTDVAEPQHIHLRTFSHTPASRTLPSHPSNVSTSHAASQSRIRSHTSLQNRGQTLTMAPNNGQSSAQPAWDTAWSIPAPPGSAPPSFHCSHHLPVSPHAALKAYRDTRLRLDYLYCELCQSIIRQMVRVQEAGLAHDNAKMELQLGQQRRSLPLAVQAKLNVLSADLQDQREAYLSRSNDLFDLSYGTAQQEEVTRQKTVGFVDQATIICGLNKKLEQKASERRGNMLGQSRTNKEMVRRHVKYQPGKFFVEDPLDTAFAGDSFNWDDANIGDGELLFSENEENEQDPRPPQQQQPRRRRVVDSP